MRITLWDVIRETLVMIDTIALWDGDKRVFRAGRVVVAEPDMEELRREVSLRAFTWISEGTEKARSTADRRRLPVVDLPAEPRAKVIAAVRQAWNVSRLRDQLRLPEA